MHQFPYWLWKLRSFFPLCFLTHIPHCRIKLWLKQRGVVTAQKHSSRWVNFPHTFQIKTHKANLCNKLWYCIFTVSSSLYVCPDRMHAQKNIYQHTPDRCDRPPGPGLQWTLFRWWNPCWSSWRWWWCGSSWLLWPGHEWSLWWASTDTQSSSGRN